MQPGPDLLLHHLSIKRMILHFLLTVYVFYSINMCMPIICIKVKCRKVICVTPVALGIAKIMFDSVPNASQSSYCLFSTHGLLGSSFLLNIHQCRHVSVGKVDELLIRTSSVMYAHNIKVNKAALEQISILK